MRAVPGLDMSSDCLFDDVGWHMRRPGNRNGRARIDDPIEGLVVEGFEHVQCTMDCEMCVSIGVLVTWICPERPTFPYPKFSISLDSGGRLVCAAEFRTSKRIDALSALRRVWLVRAKIAVRHCLRLIFSSSPCVVLQHKKNHHLRRCNVLYKERLCYNFALCPSFFLCLGEIRLPEPGDPLGRGSPCGTHRCEPCSRA